MVLFWFRVFFVCLLGVFLFFFCLFFGGVWVGLLVCYFLFSFFKYNIIVANILGIWDATAPLNMKKPTDVFTQL